MCPSVPAAFRGRPELRFDAPEEPADRPRSEEDVSGVSAGLPPVPGRVPESQQVPRKSRTSCRGSVRVLNFGERAEIKEERKARPDDKHVHVIVATLI